MVRRVAVNYIHTRFVDEFMREGPMRFGDLVAPIAAPMN